MVGVSVRASLRDLVLQRLGKADRVVVSQGFFREQLASAFEQAVPLVVAEGFVAAQESGRRASRVQVYAVDDRFWRFHGLDRVKAPGANEALLSEGLAAELDANAGQSVILRVESSSAIPTESLHGRKEDVGRSVRLTVRAGARARGSRRVFAESSPGIRSRHLCAARQDADAARAARSRECDSDRSARYSRRSSADSASPPCVDDFGLRVRALDALGAIAVESRSTILSDASAAAAMRVGGARRSERDSHADLSRQFHSRRRSRRFRTRRSPRSISLRSGGLGAEAQNAEAWSHRAQ